MSWAWRYRIHRIGYQQLDSNYKFKLMSSIYMNFHPVILFVPLLSFIACDPDDIQNDIQASDYPNYTFESMVETPHRVSSNEVLERAYQMATIEWTPINPVPMRGGDFYEPGITVKGVPYSQAMITNSYLFQDVSFHTFITAVHNPRSVFYTEDISQPPYNGNNCAAYYGSVCSTSVMWALGFNIPYLTFHIIDLPYMKKLEHQELDSLKVCDVLWKSGHVQMVYEVEHQADTLYKVKLFEQSGKRAHINSYSKKGLKQMWEEYGYVAYRYEHLSYSSEPASFSGFKEVDFNDDLCPSKGDKAVYRTDDTIAVNIFNFNYDEIVLMKDGQEMLAEPITGDLHQYRDLPVGIYEVYLRLGESYSSPVSFEVFDTEIKVSLDKGRNEMVIYFKSPDIADYVILFERVGRPHYFQISDQDRLKGYFVMPAWNVPEYYCKVVFRGEYGSISNRAIRVRK